MSGSRLDDVAEPDGPAMAALKRLRALRDCFVADMQAQGIHVGFGSPGRCVCCGDLWPCAASGEAT